MPKGWRSFAVALCAITTCAWGQAPQNQPHFVKWTVGYSRFVRNQRWAPVHVIVKNPGLETAVDISITGYDEGGARLPMVTQGRLHMPAGATRSHTFYMRFADCAKVKFELFENGRLSHQVEESPLYVGRSDSLLVAVAYSQQSFGCQQREAVQSGHGRIQFNNAMQFKNLPSRWQGYEAVDAIAMGPLPPEGLTVMQERAIVDWVRAGGLLIVSPGGNEPRYEGTLFESILPCRILGRRLVEEIPPIEAAYGKIRRFKERIGLTECEPVRGTVHYQMGQMPLLISRPEGSGRVVFVAFDLAAERLTAWPELWRLYRDLMDRRGALPKPTVTPLPEEAARLLHERVGVPVLRRSALALCLGINLLVVVLILVGMKRRRVTAFALLLLIAPVFAIAINLVGSAVAGIEGPNIAGYQFVSTASDQPDASGVGFYAVLSPKGATCDVTHEYAPSAFPESLTLPARGGKSRRTAAEAMQASYRFADGDLKWLRDVDVRPLAPATFQSSFLATMPGRVEAKAIVGPKGVRFQVVNRSTTALRECFVAMNRNATRVPSLAPGESTEVRLDRGTAQGMMARYERTAYSPDDERLVRALYRPFRINEVMDTGSLFAGWFDGEALPLKITGLKGKASADYRTLWTVRGDTETAEGASSLMLPKGTLGMHFLQPRANFVAEGQWQPMHGRTEIEVDFLVPTALRSLQASRMDFFLSAAIHPAKASVEAYNWKTERYDVMFGETVVDSTRPGDTVRTVPLGTGRKEVRLPGPSQYLSSRTGKIRIKATLEAADQTTLTRRPVIDDFDLEVEGKLE